MKKRVMALFLAALMGMSTAACGTQEEIQESNRVSVSGILPETGDVIVTTTYIGTVEPKDSITVYPMTSGNITQMSAALGKEVKKGEALFTLDNTEANKAIQEAQEEYDVLKKAADQAKKDAEAAEKEKEQAQKDAASANLQLVKTDLNNIQTSLSTAERNIGYIEDEIDDLVAKDGKYTLDTGKFNSYFTEAISNVNTANNTLENVEKNLSKIEITKTNLDNINESLKDAKAQLTDAKNDLDYAKGKIKFSIEAKVKETIEDYIEDASQAIDKVTSTKGYLATIKNNLPTTATVKTTTTSTTTSNSSTSNSSTSTTSSGTSLTTTVTTAYDQQLLLAEKKLNEAKAQLELYQVLAPIDGVVEVVYVEQNEKAFEDEPCLVISNKSNIEVTFQVPEAAALALHVGDRVKVEKNGAMNDASITEVGMMADAQTKLFTVKASLGAVTGFSTGTSVKVYADTQKATQTMIIPYDSLYFQSGEAYVYCVVEDEALRRPVQVGLMNDQYAQILDGLTAQDIVISTWSSQLKDGAEVDLLFVIGNSSTVELPEDTTEDAPAQITDDSEPVNPDNNAEEEPKWELPDLD